MSQHNSFKSQGGASQKRRNVIKRFERIALLKKRGQFQDREGARATGLPKTKPEE